MKILQLDRFKVLTVVVVLFAALLMSTTASASKTCWDNYYHKHYPTATVHIYDTHYVWMTGNQGDGEWVYWKKSRYEFGVVYEGYDYGATYCS